MDDYHGRGPAFAAGGCLNLDASKSEAGPASHLSWYYKDLQHETQGQFPAATMRAWFEAGFFNEDTMVAEDGERQRWFNIGELWKQPESHAFHPSWLPKPPGDAFAC